MKFILIADDEEQSKSFFPWWQVLLFIGLVSVTFFVLYPRHLLEKTLASRQSSPAVLNYLQAFREVYPQNIQISLDIVEQEISLGLLKQAQENKIFIQNNPQWHNADTLNQLRWIDYLFIRYNAFHAKLNTAQRISDMQKLRHMTGEIANIPLKTHQLQVLAQDCLAVAQPAIALKIYNHLFDTNSLTTPAELAVGASIAIQNNAHRDSAKFYKAAYLMASDSLEKRHYALEAIKVLWAGNLVQDALSFAQQLPEPLIHDRNILLYLSELAIAANRPDIAEQYVVKALLISVDKQHE